MTGRTVGAALCRSSGDGDDAVPRKGIRAGQRNRVRSSASAALSRRSLGDENRPEEMTPAGKETRVDRDDSSVGESPPDPAQIPWQRRKLVRRVGAPDQLVESEGERATQSRNSPGGGARNGRSRDRTARRRSAVGVSATRNSSSPGTARAHPSFSWRADISTPRTYDAPHSKAKVAVALGSPPTSSERQPDSTASRMSRSQIRSPRSVLGLS